MGVFDPGINALSIATRLLPDPIRVLDGTLKVPRNRGTPIAAELHLYSPGAGPIHAVFDWRSTGEPVWDIEVKTDAESLRLSRGGARLQSEAESASLSPRANIPGYTNTLHN